MHSHQIHQPVSVISTICYCMTTYMIIQLPMILWWIHVVSVTKIPQAISGLPRNQKWCETYSGNPHSQFHDFVRIYASVLWVRNVCTYVHICTLAILISFWYSLLLFMIIYKRILINSYSYIAMYFSLDMLDVVKLSITCTVLIQCYRASGIHTN